ncbi:hypothetical protein [Kaistella faecalis]|uniref:hypothetical protein n=1 Tax=Kaistella faecalis TaxID=2852098 RepID=UPI001C44A943|nr:hypothetical protein [Chryseobacterium faecale]UFK96990.1 hypothetical protein LL667_08380 [Chryseobacterium faecale]
MKLKLAIISVLLFGVFSAQQMKEYKVGTPVKIAVPSNYVKSYNLNDFAIAQFSNAVNEKYVVVIQTEKEHLNSVQVSFADIAEAGNYYVKSLFDGLAENGKKTVSAPKKMKIGNNDAAELLVQGTFIDEEDHTETDLFYHLTVVETPAYYYQIISWSQLKDRNKNLSEFMNIAKSFAEL